VRLVTVETNNGPASHAPPTSPTWSTFERVGGYEQIRYEDSSVAPARPKGKGIEAEVRLVTRTRDEKHDVSAEAFLNEQEPGRKRARADDEGNAHSPQDVDAHRSREPCAHQKAPNPGGDCLAGVCDHDCCRPGVPLQQSRRAVKPTKQATPRAKRPKPQIAGRTGEEPIDIKKYLMEQKIVMPFLELCEIAPQFRDGARKLMAMPRKPRASRKKPAVHSVEYVEEVNAEVRYVTARMIKDIQKWSAQAGKKRAFRLPAKVMHNGKMVEVPTDSVAADQGSDANLAYPKFIKRLGLTRYPISQFSRTVGRITLSMADGTSSEISEWVYLRVDVGGISRQVWALVCEPTAGNSSIGLLLGVPYLADVNAQIDVRSQRIVIGDGAKGEKTESIEGGEIPSVERKVDRKLLDAQATMQKDDKGSSSDDSDDSDSGDASDEVSEGEGNGDGSGESEGGEQGEDDGSAESGSQGSAESEDEGDSEDDGSAESGSQGGAESEDEEGMFVPPWAVRAGCGRSGTGCCCGRIAAGI
jgi:hypothetical protein